MALPFGLGLAVGASLWCLFALAGLALLFKTYPPLYYSVKILGGFYIIWVAWGMWRAATSPLPEAAEKRFGRGFLGGVLLNLSKSQAGTVLCRADPAAVSRPADAGRQCLDLCHRAVDGTVLVCDRHHLDVDGHHAPALLRGQVLDRPDRRNCAIRTGYPADLQKLRE